jgi:hypothetical protein
MLIVFGFTAQQTNQFQGRVRSSLLQLKINLQSAAKPAAVARDNLILANQTLIEVS